MQNGDGEDKSERREIVAGYHEVSEWTVLQLTGDDRVKFLQSFCTADVDAMALGDTQEAFVLNGKGKTIGHVTILMVPDALLLVGPAGQAEALMQHLDMYIIRDDVQLEDRSSSTRSFLVAGSRAADRVASLFRTAPEKGKCQTIGLEDAMGHLAYAEFAGDCFWLGIQESPNDHWPDRLEAGGCEPLSEQALVMWRLAKGTPWFGEETTANNLPQELNRDEKTISFTKGCYLGQETVARIDSLGRVNRLLVVLDFAEDEPAVGQELVMEGKTVGEVTSVGAASGTAGWRALAFVKRDFASVGTVIGNGVVASGSNPPGT